MAREEKAIAAEGFDKRLNQLIRDFVKMYNKLRDEFLKYKVYVQKELDVLNLVVQGKDKEIAKLMMMITEFKLALRIPRQHYKYIEKLRFEELIEQREEIRDRHRKKYGIDPALPGALLRMPDPSLPPEQQMEMLEGGGGKLAGGTGAGSPSNPLSRSPTSKGLLGSPQMQKEYSMFSLASKTTNDTKFQSEMGDHSLIMSPSIRFGMQKSRAKKSLGNAVSQKSPF